MQNIENNINTFRFLSGVCQKTTLLFFLLSFFLTACGGKQTDIPENQAHDIKDVRTISQNPLSFVAKNSRVGGGEELLFSYKEIERKYPELLLVSQVKANEELVQFYKLFFTAWGDTKLTKNNITYFNSFLNRSYEKRGYAENLQKWTDEDMAELRKNAQYDDAPNFIQKAITVRDTALRVAPTQRPYFYQPKKEGDAYPFDMFQNSSLSLGTPVTIFHVSQNGLWYYVECASAAGWIFAHDVAFVDDIFINKWKKYAQKDSFIALIKDNIPVIEADTRVLASLGAVLPISSEGIKNFKTLVPYRASNGKAKIDKVKIAHENAVILPLPFTAQNVALIAKDLMGNLYGWGGLYGNRDCSSTLQDLFTPFGVYLPRNSRAQSIVGEKFSLENMTTKEKDRAIIQNAIPFQTLIYLPGHIGLYIGHEKEKALMLHNMWGIRLQQDKRYVVGKTVITTLYPGMEHPKAVKSLMERVQSFNIIAR